MCTYILNGWVLVSGDVTSSRHSVFIKFNSDSPGFARCCLWNTFRALWAPKGPQTRDRISSFDCPSNFVKYLLISIMLTLRFASRQLFSSSCFKIISVVLYANTWWRPCKLHFFNHYKLRPWYVSSETNGEAMFYFLCTSTTCLKRNKISFYSCQT